MTTIYLIRHAEAEGNIYRRYHGWYNSLITLNGYRQIQALEKRFEGVRIDAVYSSDLFRTMTTAGALYKSRGLELHTDPGLREIGGGVWEDKTWGWLHRENEGALDAFNRADPAWQVEGSETFYPHTGVIVSVSQGSESNLVKTTTGIETNQKGLLSVSEDGRTTREGVFAGGDAVMGARTVVEAVAVAKKVAVAMDEYMKSLPADTTADPYADIPVFQTPTSDVLAKQQL